jgi:hypothetical protein
MSEIHDVLSENYTRLSDEYAKAHQQHVKAILDLQQQYLESVKATVKAAMSVHKEYHSNPNTQYSVPNITKVRMENMVEKSNEYTTNAIKWLNIQNQFLIRAIEASKEYAKNYNSAVEITADYYTDILKARNASLAKIQ